MYSILTGTILISIFHALIPSHWLPVLAISRNNKWERKETMWVTFYMGVAHVLSTILVGVALSFLGGNLYQRYTHYFDLVAPIALCLIGIYFIYRHYTHHHFHINDDLQKQKIPKRKIIFSLVTIMFFSPCLEVEGFFLMAGKYSVTTIIWVALIYMLISIAGMLLWMQIALHGLKKLDWHKIEHNAGLFTGFILILTGIFTFFIH